MSSQSAFFMKGEALVCDSTCMNVYFSDRPLEPRSHTEISQVTTGCAHGVSSSQVNKGRDEPTRDEDGNVWADSHTPPPPDAHQHPRRN